MNFRDINKRIVDRSDVFYWQAERKISREEAAEIWKDRHSAIKNSELLVAVNNALKQDKCISIDEMDLNSQEASGSVNSNRVGHLKSGQDVIIRCHPKGVKNGYFYVESLAADVLKQHKIPSYKTYAIHDCQNKNDCAFQVIEKIKGFVVDKFLQQNPQKESQIVYDVGKTMAKIHKIKVLGFGPFDNDLAKKGVLQGRFSNLYQAVFAGLNFDLETLLNNKVISKKDVAKYKKLFKADNPLLQTKQPVLVHNDLADWNILTDGKKVNAVLDLDECVGGDPVADIACWSLFFKPERLENFLKGYFSVSKPIENFEDKFQLYRLRYSLSKLTLRVLRYNYEKSDFIKQMIENGKIHLKESSNYFKI